MGITGLIPFLEKASSKVHLKNLRGSTVAVDTYCWLHKGVFSCAEQLVRGEETDVYIQYCLKYVNMLLSYDIKPILVFDGRHLPAKALTEKRRRESRQQSKKRAAELLRLGQTEEARSHMRRCVDVTHEMALRLIRECRERNVDCIVAPYEADAQMAWLNKVDLAQYVITEDSDLTIFGARKIIFKLDLTGAGLLVESEKLYLAMGCRQERFTFDKFRQMCILSGCDYLDSLPGIGLVKACKFVLKTEETDMWRALKKIPQYLNMRNLEVDDEYIEKFLKAEATFKHMFIYNPLKRKMERLHELEEFDTNERYCSNAGTLLEDSDQAFNLALGNLNPFNFKQLDNWNPDNIRVWESTASKSKVKRAKHRSIWVENYESHTLVNKGIKNDSSESTFCGIYFKKVDFINKTIDDDLNASRKEEESKPAEEDIFSMYKNEGNEMSTQLKRKRSVSVSSNEEVRTVTTPSSPIGVRTRCNPFAKAVENSLASSLDVCKNSSLLKILSPKKCEMVGENVNFSTSASTAKISIFGNAEKFEETTNKVEVRSRFFAANVRQITQKQSIQTHNQAHEKPSEDLTNEINRIELLTQQTEENQLQLYNHCTPSPKKQKTKIIEEIEEVNKLIEDDNQSTTENVYSLWEKYEKCSQDSCSHRSQQTNDTDSVVLSNNSEDSDFDTDSSKSSKKPPLALYKFNSKRTPRLGLSNPKKTITKNKSNSKISASSSQQTNQTRLSMFGFQKRPTLK